MSDGDLLRIGVVVNRVTGVDAVLKAAEQVESMGYGAAWLCPADYLAKIAAPALARGTEAVGRMRPPLIAHVAACVHDDGDEVREAVRNGIPNIGFPAYQKMLVKAGLDEASGGVWSDGLVDRVIVWGSPENVVAQIRELFDIGADEVLLRPIGTGPAPDEVIQRTLESVAALF